MKKIMFAFALAALLVLFAGCGGQQPSQGGIAASQQQATPAETSSGGATSTTGGTSTGAATGTASTASITIQNFAFNPATLTVAKGTTVTWTNEDSAPHQLHSAEFDSPALNRGETFQYKFENAGTYEYSCAIHPSMKGTVIVQ